ncbi:MAG: hypothetical protein NG740_05915 [Omnitrophica bacterium]|nr:hypothetical protein [Candidatus Omnitrophota bacterium]
MYKKYILLVAVSLIIFLAIFVRFTGLSGKEFFQTDKFYFYESTRNVSLVKSFFAESPAVMTTGDLVPTYILGFWRIIFSRDTFLPLYYVVSLFSALISGVRPETAFYRNALFCILTLFPFFLLCKELFSIRAAAIAILLLAFSPAHVYYSRFGYSISMVYSSS